jgi:AI-2 transport protein TqsA
MDAAPDSHQRIQTFSLLTLAAVALGAALRWLSPVMVPFVLAFFLTVVLTPVVEALHRKLHLPRLLALGVTGLLGLAGLVGLGVLVTLSVSELQENESAYVERWEKLEGIWTNSAAAAFLGFDQGPSELEGEVGAEPVEADPLTADEQLGLAPPNPHLRDVATGFVTGAINALLSMLSQGVLVMIFMMFLVSGRAHSGTLGDVERRIKGYVMTKIVVSSITGVLTWLILMLLGIEMAVVFGLFAFLLNFVPSVGSIIATVLPLPVVLMGDYGLAQMITAIVLPGIVQFSVGNLLEPRMLGDSMDLHPVTILLALIFWGMIWGFVGALLATPITAVVRILLDKAEVTRPLAELMAGRLPGESPPPVRSTA